MDKGVKILNVLFSMFYCKSNIGSCDLKVFVFILFKRPNISVIRVVDVK